MPLPLKGGMCSKLSDPLVVPRSLSNLSDKSLAFPLKLQRQRMLSRTDTFSADML